MLKELLTLNIFGFLLIFSRVGAAITVMPGFSAPYVNVRARLVIALAISFVLGPVLAQKLPGLPSTAVGLGVLLAGEIIIGVFLGTLALILMGALQTAGTIISYVSSMANAFIQDPIAQQQSSLISGFLSTIGILLVFITDMHHLMLAAVIDSYTLFVPGQALAFGNIVEVIGRRVMDSFALGVQLASPLIITGFVYYLGLGLLSRLMPAMQVFFIGLPVQIAIQISVFTLTLSTMMLVFLSRFEEGYEVFLAP